jgi:protoporphyrinogen oxidase
MEPARKLRVAVVGSGMAGLVTAYLLHGDAEQRYDVTIFEEVPLA